MTARRAAKERTARRDTRKARGTRKRATTKPIDLTIISDPVQSAKAAGLRYVTDEGPGIRRKRAGKGFTFVGPDGKRLTDPEEIDRARRLGIPPAWTSVWICPDPRGHIQATGRDARGRKQYRYHERFRAVRDETKYHRMLAFGRALPRLRERTDAALKLPGLPREKVLATVVRLLETTLIRVGNDEYARANASFGLTTMRDEHVEIEGQHLRFHFRGKSGKEHSIDVKDKRLARIIHQCNDLPGHELFQYIDENGERQRIHSGDVNDYLHEVAGEAFTAKDFRTWAGTILAATALQAFEEFDSQTQAKRNVVAAIESVSKRLGNTKTICRKCYIHPAIIDAYLDKTLVSSLKQRAEEVLEDSLQKLAPEEAAVMGLLHERLRREEKSLERKESKGKSAESAPRAAA